MRKWIILFLTLLVISLPISAAAHSGHTDSEGGHTDHKTGEYHYHHGYPAHDHADLDGDGDLDCPYEFRDLTGSNSGGSSGGSSGSPGLHLKPEFTVPYKPGSTTIIQDKDDADAFDPDEFKEDATPYIAVLIGIPFLLSMIVSIFNKKVAALLALLGCIFLLLCILLFGVLSIIGWFI